MPPMSNRVKYLLSRCLRPELLQVFTAFEVLATTQGLTGAAKVLNLKLRTCKLDT